MNEFRLKIILFPAYLLFFVAWGLPSYYGGALWTLKIDDGHFYLSDHNIVTEVDPSTLFWLFGLSGAGLVALVISIISAIALARKILERKRIERNGQPFDWGRWWLSWVWPTANSRRKN